MSDAPFLTPPACADASSGGWARPMLDRQLQVLGELAEIGLELARAVEAEAKGPEPDLDKAVLAYARVSRAIRQSIMLQSRLIEALQGSSARTEADRARRGEVKARLRDVVRRAAEAGAEAPERVERLVAEAAERLEQEAWGDLLSRPVLEIVADICRDLGLHPDWRGLQRDIRDIEDLIAGKEPKESGRIEVVWLDSGASDSS